MSRERPIQALVALTAALLCGCGSSSDAAPGALSFTTAPLATLTSTSGALTIELRATTATPARGDDAFDLRVTDVTGAAVDGLTVQALPWMPAMGHGASITPTVTAKGGGEYLLTSVDFFMPGQWELRLHFASATPSAASSSVIDDDAVATFDVL